MTLKVFDPAPDFEAVAHDGRRIALSEYRDKKNVVLYFYPADFTRVCTQEACGFRDLYDELVGKDTEVVGVSVDSDESHGRFAAKHGVTFPLIADTKMDLATRYGATSLFRDLLGKTKRLTFVIDKQGKIAGIFDSQIRAGQHLKGVQETVARLR